MDAKEFMLLLEQLKKYMNDQLIFQLTLSLSPFNVNVFGIKPTKHVI